MEPTNTFWENYYELAWGARFKKMQQFRDAGETHPLRLIRKFDSFQRFNSLKWNGSQFDFIPTELKIPPDYISPAQQPILTNIGFLDREVQIPAYYMKEIHTFLLDYLNHHEFDAIVELGSGYAQNLINLFYNGGPKVSYYAGEFTESGTQCAKMLADLSSEMKLVPFHFNHLKPDLSALPRQKKILFFTCHSLEQIAQVPEIFFKTVASHSEKVVCFHFEPFGYQIPGSNSAIDQAHGSYFKKQGWNQNLYPMLVACNQAKIISLKYVGKNIFGGDPTNPTSVALWESVKKN